MARLTLSLAFATWSVLILVGGRWLLLDAYRWDLLNGVHWHYLQLAFASWWSSGTGPKGSFVLALLGLAAAWIVGFLLLRSPLTSAVSAIGTGLGILGRRGWRIVAATFGWRPSLGGLKLPSWLKRKPGAETPRRRGHIRFEIAWGDDDQPPKPHPAARAVTPALAPDEARPRMVIGEDGVENRRDADATDVHHQYDDAAQDEDGGAGLVMLEEEETAEPSSDAPAPEGSDEDVRAATVLWLRGHGWGEGLRFNVAVNGDYSGGFAPDAFDDNPCALLPVLVLTSVEIHVIFTVSLRGTIWSATPWNPDRAGIPLWTDEHGDVMPCPVATARRASFRFLDHHGGLLSEQLGITAGSIVTSVIVDHGDVANLDEVEPGWLDAGIELVHRQIDGAMERVFGSEPPPEIEDKATLLVLKKISDDSAEIARAR